MMIHQAKDYGRLVAQCHGFLSEAQLRAHFELYHGYVNTFLHELYFGNLGSPKAEVPAS